MKRELELTTDGDKIEVEVEALGFDKDRHSATVYHWIVTFNGDVMFDNSELSVPRSIYRDTDLAAMASALIYASITHDDGVEDEYFKDHTPEMMDFAERWSDDMSMWAEDLEAEAALKRAS